jgi:putative transposase
MNFSPDHIYHIYNQGNNRQKIFHEKEDYHVFLSLYKRAFPKICSTLAWCLMPNHFHFMIHTDKRCEEKKKQGGLLLDPITNNIRKLLSGYSRIFNKKYKRTGSLFRQKTKANRLSESKLKLNTDMSDNESFITCFNYIHQNPIRAGLVTKLEDWEFSSFRDYAGLRNNELCARELAMLYCNYKEDNFLDDSYDSLIKYLSQEDT